MESSPLTSSFISALIAEEEDVEEAGAGTCGGGGGGGDIPNKASWMRGSRSAVVLFVVSWIE
jgi:hypothetical protein